MIRGILGRNGGPWVRVGSLGLGGVGKVPHGEDTDMTLSRRPGLQPLGLKTKLHSLTQEASADTRLSVGLIHHQLTETLTNKICQGIKELCTLSSSEAFRETDPFS